MSRTENSRLIKAKAQELGVDLTGIAPAEELNLNPPDPRWPQTPQRIWDECSSVIVIAKRVPWGIFRARDLSTRLYVPHLVMGRLDTIALGISYFIEEQGFRAFPVAQNYTDPTLKRGTYGSISLRHAAVEAGLGTLGLNLNLITPQFGPRVYLQAILTDFPLEPDERLKNPVCLGPKCGRCLLSCPSDAVGHWNIDKRRCSTQAQRYGVAALFRHLHHIIDAETKEEAKSLIRSMETVNFWQALRTGAGAYGGCLRCWEVCPVGEDYNVHLKDLHASIPESTPEKRNRLKEMIALENGESDEEYPSHSTRWTLWRI